MKLNFSKVNPAGNTTIYIWDPVPKELHGRVSRKILDVCHLGGEQVGFVQLPQEKQGKALARLQMMGGEFCGNASRGLAALMLERGFSGFNKIGDTYHGFLEVSGADDLIEIWVRPLANQKYWAECTVPVPLRTRDLRLDVNNRQYRATLVDFPGISHLVVSGLDPSKDVFVQIKEQLPAGTGEGALGIMFYRQEQGTMTPLVYVKAADSLIWEGSCGSGSVAAAVSKALTDRKSVSNLPLQQPLGLISVDVEYVDGNIHRARIKGEVELVADGTAFVLFPY